MPSYSPRPRWTSLILRCASIGKSGASRLPGLRLSVIRPAFIKVPAYWHQSRLSALVYSVKRGQKLGVPEHPLAAARDDDLRHCGFETERRSVRIHGPLHDSIAADDTASELDSS